LVQTGNARITEAAQMIAITEGGAEFQRRHPTLI
jgi:hypothetical protein